MKKIYLTTLVLFLIFCTAACSSPKENADISAVTAAKTVQGASEAQETKAAVLDMGKEDNTRLTVAQSGPEERFIEIAAANFHKINPGIVVEVKYYTPMGESMTGKTEDGQILAIGENTDPGGDKYLKKISTELMSGQGPDIIDTYYIPSGKFSDNGFLCDIGAIIKQDVTFDKSCYYENILTASKYKGGLFTLPISFTTSCIEGKYSLPSDTAAEKLTLGGFFNSAGKALKENGVNGTYILFADDMELFIALFDKYYDSFVQQESNKCDFTSGKFVNMIKQIKEAKDKKLIGRPRAYTKNKEFLNLYGLIDSNPTIYFLSTHGQNYVYPIPSLDGEASFGADISCWEYGINNNSKSKGAAWKFLKYLISEEMQSSPELFHLPINKNAMAKRIELEKVSDNKISLTANDPIFSKFKVYPKKSQQVCRIVEEETEKYFDGQRSAEATAEIIQSRVNVVINE